MVLALDLPDPVDDDLRRIIVFGKVRKLRVLILQPRLVRFTLCMASGIAKLAVFTGRFLPHI
jgi:hypothetical protein